MKTVIIVQTRMSSTRLPGKVLKEIMGRPVLELFLERLNRISVPNEAVIATTVNSADDAIVEFCKKRQLRYFRGSELDVLGRFYACAQETQADCVVRINSDCPLIDPAVSSAVMTTYIQNMIKFDYVSNTLKPGFPIGLLTEVFSFQALKRAHESTTDPYDREHVTPYFYRNPSIFRLGAYESKGDFRNISWVLDTEEDFKRISLIFERLYNQNKNFLMADILQKCSDI